MKQKLLLTGLMLLLGLTVSAQQSGTCGENLTWTLEDGTLTISGTGDMTNYESYNSVPWYSSHSSITSVVISDGVTSIGDFAFSGYSSLTSVTIPNNVTRIGYGAFSVCSRLTSVTISNSVTSIGEGAFYYCKSLTSVTIPNSVTSIGERVFENCSSLTSIKVEAANPAYCDIDGVLFNKDKTTLVIYPVGKTTASYTIPNSVTSIGDRAFSGCSSLTSVTISNSVTNIGNMAFADCRSLTSITIPNNVTSIGQNAFSVCSSLTSVTIGNSVTSIGYGAFSNCSSLTSIKVDDANAAYCDIDGVLFSKDKTTLVIYPCGKTDVSYTIPNSVTSIGQNAFADCSSLTSVTISNSVTNIGNMAFADCRSLTSVTIPNSVTSIEDYAFEWCSSLTSITIPNSVTSIGSGAFVECRSLTSVTIPNSVTSIGEEAFRYCSSLTSVTIPNSVTSIGNYAFSGCSSLTSVTIPNSVTSIGSGAFSGCSSLTSVTIPNSVTSIGDGAFWGCNSLTSVTIPNSVTSIGNYAFSGCSSLTSVTIPNSVTSIGESAFYGCSSLTSVTIPNSVTSIDYNAFGWCTSLNTIYNYATEPQYIDKSVFSKVDLSACLLIVPQESMPLYKSARVWKFFLFEDGTLKEQSYSDCELELVGDAIADQEGAIPDPSGWKWGNVYPMGTPVQNGNTYTWYASKVHITTIGYGFQIRTKNFQPSGEIGWLINYTINYESLTVSEDALYDITFTFNSDTEEMTYSCVKHITTAIDATINPQRVQTSKFPRKVMRDGVLYILMPDGRMYDLQGGEVK